MTVDRVGSCLSGVEVDAGNSGRDLAVLGGDRLAVVLGASPELNGFGIGFHTLRHGRCSL